MILDLETSCTSQELANILGIVGRFLSLIGIIVPILLIVFSCIKLVKMVNNPDDKKGFKSLFNSALAAAIIFFIPVLMNVVVQLMGEKYNFSSCWMLAKENKVSLNARYISIDEKHKRQPIIIDSSGYEKGKERSNSSIHSGTSASGINSETSAKLVEAARSQLGLPYYSMHYGPREGDGLGFGCAMFVSYCYNQVFFGGVSGQDMGLGGFYGSTWEYWGNVTNDGYDAYNKTFIEVPANEAQAGDVIAYLRGGDHYASAQNCYHVGLYIGDGKIIDSSDYGVTEREVDINRSDFHFLRYTGNG